MRTNRLRSEAISAIPNNRHALVFEIDFSRLADQIRSCQYKIDLGEDIEIYRLGASLIC